MGYHATRGNFFKGLILWRFVRDYDRKARINKAMWEEKENGSDNALCHSYYTSQLLRPRRTLEVTGIICLSRNAGPVPQPVGSHVILDFSDDIWTQLILFHFACSFSPVVNKEGAFSLPEDRMSRSKKNPKQSKRTHCEGKYNEVNELETSKLSKEDYANEVSGL